MAGAVIDAIKCVLIQTESFLYSSMIQPGGKLDVSPIIESYPPHPA